MNLLNNAIDALEEYNIKRSFAEISADPVSIEITTTRIENRIKIEIADNGQGIPESVQKRLFDPFFTTKAIGKGTGLGLSISYSIITEQHHGELGCISELGQGAKFIIEIPTQQKG